jgi:hypothetical protein
MAPMNQMSCLVISVVASLVLGGCAADAIRTGTVARHYRHVNTDHAVARKQAPADIDTGSIAKGAAPAATDPVNSKEDPRWQWCEQRHIDHQAGKAPGGATDLNKKLEDDRLCAAVYQRG